MTMIGLCKNWIGYFVIVAGLCLVISGCGTPEDPEVEKEGKAAIRENGARMVEDGGHVGKVDFSGKKVTDADFANIAKLPRLEQLILVRSTIDEGGLAHLSNLKRLGQMSLQGSNVTDAGLEHVGKLVNLTQLDLGGTKITDAGLEHLRGLKQLQKLYIGGSTATSSGGSKLKESLPKLSVIGD
jgi:Leucine-rich repeat (LRR) protein